MFMIFFGAVPCHYFSVPRFSVPGRAKIFRAMIFRAGPCHKSPGPPFRAVPGRPWDLSGGLLLTSQGHMVVVCHTYHLGEA